MNDTLKQWVLDSRRIVFFGGAGVSTESGIPDFRGVDGLYHQKYDYPPETILSHDFFIRHPEEFYRFYRDKMLVDGAQSTPHIPVNVRELGADFFAFSGHKLYAPMGIGVLYGKKELLDKMPPFLTGGEMIESVTRTSAVYAELPHKFEAGTVNAAGAAGLKAAIGYINSIGFDKIHELESSVTAYTFKKMQQMEGINIIGSDRAEDHSEIITFTVDDVHPHDVSEIMAADGVAVRAGHHCAQPLLSFLGCRSTVRASFAFYNTFDDADKFINSLSTVRERMGYGKQKLL